MAEKSKTAAAAEKAVAKSRKQEKVERSQEQIIRDIRIHLESKLAVTPGDVAVLLAAYDAEVSRRKAGSIFIEEQLPSEVEIVDVARAAQDVMSAAGWKSEQPLIVPAKSGE